MKKNVASQVVGAQMVNASDGSAFTSAVTVAVLGDGGTQATGSVGSGACTHEGNGFHTYAPAQAETNYDHIAFTFTGSGAVPASVQVYTSFPQTVDNATNISAIKTKTDSLTFTVANVLDANALRVGGTVQTARDIGASVLLSSGTGTGQLKLASGYVAMTWADVAAPTTTVNLSGTTIATTQKVDVETIKTNPVVNAGTITFPTTATLASTTNITAGTIATVTNLTNAPTAGDFTATMKTSIGTAVAASAVASVTGNVGGSVASVVGLTAATVHSDLDDIQTRLPAALVSGRMDSSVGAMAANVITAAATASDYLAEINAEADTAIADAALATAANLATVAGYIDTEVAAILADTNELQTDWANGGRLDNILDARASQTSVDDLPTNAELATALGTADDAVLAQVALVKAVTDKLDDTLEDDGGTYRFTANALEEAPTGGGSMTVQDIVDGVWDEPITDHLDSGSTGAALNAAGSAGDPWSTTLPGAYGSGTAGKIVGDNIDAAISTRATQTSVDDLPTNAELATALGTADDAVLTQVALVKADTAAILIDTAEIGAAGAGLTALASATNLATVAGYLDTEIAAILADTNELQTDWANGGRLDNILDARASQTSVDDLPTNAELATALGTADDAVLAAVAALPTAEENADALLDRDMGDVAETNARSPLNALRFLRNKWTISGTTLSVKKEDDSTEAWTATVSTTPGADPVTGNDPA